MSHNDAPVRRQQYETELARWTKHHRWCYLASQACVLAGLPCALLESPTWWLLTLALCCLTRIPYNYCHARAMGTIAAENARLRAETEAMLRDLERWLT